MSDLESDNSENPPDSGDPEQSSAQIEENLSKPVQAEEGKQTEARSEGTSTPETERQSAKQGRLTEVEIAAEQAQARTEQRVTKRTSGQTGERVSLAATPEERQRHLWIRIVTVSDFYRVLGACNATEETIKEAIIDIGESFTTACESGVIDENEQRRLENELSAVEDKLLKLADGIPRVVFRRMVSERQIPAEQLRRYARLLASHPFPIGMRLEHFDYLITRLLCVQTVSGFFQFMDRQTAKAVLRDIVGGLENQTSEEERRQTLQTINDALQKLPEFHTLDEFFDSGYYLDVYGYKLSDRDKLTDPEVLYNTAALNAAIINRLAQLRDPTVSLDALTDRLLKKEEEVRDILEPRTVTRRKSERPQATKAKSGPKEEGEEEKLSLIQAILARYPALSRIDKEMFKQRAAIALVVIALATISIVLWQSMGGGKATATALNGAKLHRYSNELVQGWIVEKSSKTTLEAAVSRKWIKKENWERNKIAESILANLKGESIKDALIVIFPTQTKAIDPKRHDHLCG